MANLTTQQRCHPWPLETLFEHGVRPHDKEWEGQACCARRSIIHRGFGPDTDGTLKPNAVRMLVLLVADSGNFTRALTLANVAAFSQLPDVNAHFLLVVSRCAKWSSMLAEVQRTLGMRIDCVEQPDAPMEVRLNPRCARRTSAASICSARAFRPKLPLQLHGLEALRLRRQAVSGDVDPSGEKLADSATAAAKATAMPASLPSSPPSLQRQGSSPSLLDGYDAVWMPDADIAFTADGVAAALLRWACAFESGPPLISQPAIHGDVGRTGRSQQFWHLNYGLEWQPEGRLAAASALACHVPYVEQQAPLFDARFFEWFVNVVGRPLASMQRTHGTDMGTDQLWCRAATHFARRQASGSGSGADNGRRQQERPGCAVLPVPFRHRGSQRRRPVEFWRGSNAVREAAAARWPEFWLEPRLLHMFKLSSEHVEERRRLPADRCMVRLVSSRKIGRAC